MYKSDKCLQQYCTLGMQSWFNNSIKVDGSNFYVSSAVNCADKQVSILQRQIFRYIS